jgi:hypothetical protein
MTLMQFETQLFVEADCLISRKLELAQRSNIEDMQAYAEEWERLAADFDAAGLVSNAEDCRTRWQHYKQFSGEYIRLTDAPFADLLPVGDMDPAEAKFYTDWIV